MSAIIPTASFRMNVRTVESKGFFMKEYRQEFRLEQLFEDPNGARVWKPVPVVREGWAD